MVIQMKIVALIISVVAVSTQAQSLPDPGLATPALIAPIATYTQSEIARPTITYYQSPTVMYYPPTPITTYYVQQPIAQYYYRQPVQYYRPQIVSHGSFLRRR